MGTPTKSLRSAVLGAVTIAAAGCGGGIVPVGGKVVYTDGAAPEGAIRVIRFEPTDDTTAELRKVASGRLADDGSFTLTTRKPGDGAYCGQYVVTLTVIANPESGESVIPLQYTHADVSPLAANVERAKDDFLFEIKRRSSNAR